MSTFVPAPLLLYAFGCICWATMCCTCTSLKVRNLASTAESSPWCRAVRFDIFVARESETLESGGGLWLLMSEPQDLALINCAKAAPRTVTD